MKKIFALAFIFALSTFGFMAVGGVDTAYACNKGVSCKQPVGVGRGNKVPVWHVSHCVVGNPGNYTTVDCKSSRALHRSPLGKMAVCFVGTDDKVHWDNQREVHVGRPFINRRLDGRWQPDWQDARPY